MLRTMLSRGEEEDDVENNDAEEEEEDDDVEDDDVQEEDRSQNREPEFARARSVEMHMDMPDHLFEDYR